MFQVFRYGKVKDISLVYHRFLDKNDHRAPDVEITLNGKVVAVPNPDLVMEAKVDGYHLTGKIALTDPQTLKDLGWAPGKNLFVAKITFGGDIDAED